MAEKKEQPDSDLAYTHAVEAINRSIRELDEILGVNQHEQMERVADQKAWRVR